MFEEIEEKVRRYGERISVLEAYVIKVTPLADLFKLCADLFKQRVESMLGCDYMVYVVPTWRVDDVKAQVIIRPRDGKVKPGMKGYYPRTDVRPDDVILALESAGLFVLWEPTCNQYGFDEFDDVLTRIALEENRKK